MSFVFGLAILVLSIVLLKTAKKYELAGRPHWVSVVRSTWFPILFTAMFGLGVVAMIGGILTTLGA